MYSVSVTKGALTKAIIQAGGDVIIDEGKRIGLLLSFTKTDVSQFSNANLFSMIARSLYRN
jgi:hypothetical protein